MLKVGWGVWAAGVVQACLCASLLGVLPSMHTCAPKVGTFMLAFERKMNYMSKNMRSADGCSSTHFICSHVTCISLPLDLFVVFSRSYLATADACLLRTALISTSIRDP